MNDQPASQGFTCPLCAGTRCETVSERDRHGGPLKTVVCLGCGLVANDPVPSDEELAAFYRSDYRTSYKGAAEPRMRQVWRNFNGMAGHMAAYEAFYRGRSKVIDLGSGSGEFLFLAGRMGMDAVGVEPNDGYAAYSRERLGLNVLTQTLEETQFEDGTADLVRLSHVMEHMRDPVRSLKVLRGWLKDDGLLYIEVPNIDRDAASKARGKIFHYGHIYNFNPWTMRAAARLAGFVEDERSAGRNAATTSGFFRKGPEAQPRDVANAPNAQRVAAALRRHNERALPEPADGTALGKAVSTLSLRVGEILSSWRFSQPRDIAEHFAARLPKGQAA